MTRHCQQPAVSACNAVPGWHGPPGWHASIREHASGATRVSGGDNHGSACVDPCHAPRRCVAGQRARRAFSLAEVAISVLLVGGLLVAALTTLGGAAAGRRTMANRGLGELLAQDLMGEILRQPYEEPVDTPSFGRETGETGGTRAAYDDVDDYDGWFASPPQHKDGTVFVDLTGWRRDVQVHRVNANDLTQVVAAESGVKRIIVTVKHNEVVVASIVAVRTGAVPLRRRLIEIAPTPL